MTKDNLREKFESLYFIKDNNLENHLEGFIDKDTGNFTYISRDINGLWLGFQLGWYLSETGIDSSTPH